MSFGLALVLGFLAGVASTIAAGCLLLRLIDGFDTSEDRPDELADAGDPHPAVLLQARFHTERLADERLRDHV